MICLTPRDSIVSLSVKLHVESKTSQHIENGESITKRVSKKEPA